MVKILTSCRELQGKSPRDFTKSAEFCPRPPTLPPSLILVIDTADREDRVDIAPLRLNFRQPITIVLEAETANQISAVFEHDLT